MNRWAPLDSCAKSRPLHVHFFVAGEGWSPCSHLAALMPTPAVCARMRARAGRRQSDEDSASTLSPTKNLRNVITQLDVCDVFRIMATSLIASIPRQDAGDASDARLGMSGMFWGPAVLALASG